MFSLLQIDDSVRNVLDAQVRHFSTLVGLANITVAVGVAMEGVEYLHDAIAWIKRRRIRKKELVVQKELTEIFPAGEIGPSAESKSDHPKWVKRFTRIGLIVVVVGVIAEWRCGTKLEDAHNAVHEYDLAKLTAAGEKASQIEQENIKLRIELAKVQRASGRRYLSPHEQDELVAILSQYKLKSAGIFCVQGNTEPIWFGDDLEKVFNRLHVHPSRGWFSTVPLTDGTGKRIDLAPPGVTIEVLNPSKPPPAAKALKKFLTEMDLLATIRKNPLNAVFPPDDTLRIVIGSK